MYSRTHRLIAGLLLILFSGISLAGHGLHFLPGLGHGHCRSHGAAEPAPPAAACAPSCCHRHHAPAAGDADSDQAQVQSGLLGEVPHDHDCSICRLLAQAKLPLRFTSPAYQQLPVAATSVAGSSADLQRIFEHAGRGPPLTTAVA